MSPGHLMQRSAALLLMASCASPLAGRLDAAIEQDAETPAESDAGVSAPLCEELAGNTISLPFQIQTAPRPLGIYPSVALISTTTELYYHDFSSTHLHRRSAESTWADLGAVTVGQVPTQETNTLGDSSALVVPSSGAILVMHQSQSAETRLASYTPDSGVWALDDIELETSHGMVLVGDEIFGLQHAGALPLKRMVVTSAGDGAQFEDNSRPSSELLGSDPYWMSRVADLANNGSAIYGIKNDWATDPRGDGDRLFQFDAGDYVADGETPMTDLGELPFEIGDGAVLVFLPAGWLGQVSSQGGLFVTEGRSPSNQEGFGDSASDQYAVYDIGCATWRTGSLPSASGSGTSAVMFDSALYIKSGGDPIEPDDSLWVVQ